MHLPLPRALLLPCVYPFPGSDFASILLEHPDEDGSVLNKHSVDAFWDLNAKIVQVEVNPSRTRLLKAHT